MSDEWIEIHTLWFTVYEKWTKICELAKLKVRTTLSSQIHNYTERKKEGSKLTIEYHSKNLNSLNWIHIFWDMSKELLTCHIQSNYQLLIH